MSEQPSSAAITFGPAIFVLIIGVLICAVPFLGSLVAGMLGVLFIRWGRDQVRTAARHELPRAPPALDDVRMGELACIAGTVTSPNTVKTPLGQDAAIAVGWIDSEPDDVASSSGLVWSKQWGKELALSCDGGSVRLNSEGLDVITVKVKANTWDDKPPPALLEVLSTIDRDTLPKNELLEYGERVIAAGAQVVVTGKVASIDEKPTAGGYRDEGRARQLTLASLDDGTPIRIADSPHTAATLAAEGRGLQLAGYVLIPLAVACAGVWVHIFN